MKTNEELQKDVQKALKWEPLLHYCDINVTAADGVITLTGAVDAYLQKVEAENAAKNVEGVKAVVEKIVVKHDDHSQKSDSEIASQVLKWIEDSWSIPDDKIKVKVEDGWVTLEGEVPWNYQREAAMNSINYLIGIKGVTNNIKIKSEKHDAFEKKKIEKAMARNWTLNSENIKVKVKGTNVILSGKVSSLFQKEEAARLAWKTPGIWSVDNKLTVG